MNEVRHVLTALRSPAKISTLSNGAVVGVATATWYDIPAPVIVHCREFREDAERNVRRDDGGTKERERSCEKEAELRDEVEHCEKDMSVKSFEKNAEISTCDTKGGSLEKNMDTKSLEKNTSTAGRPSSSDGEALYQNNVEAALNSLSKVCADSSKLEASPELRAKEVESDRSGKRHSNTVELNATTTVTTDSDGVPTISFSFLRADEKFHRDGADEDEIVVLEVDTSDQTDFSCNQLYDLPKSTVIGSSRVSLSEQSNGKEIDIDSSSPVIRQELYDVPKPTKDASLNAPREEEAPTDDLDRKGRKKAAAALDSSKRNRSEQIKRSTRSLKSGRRSYGASDSDGYDAGIASMSGSYSDPECPNEAALSVSGSSDRSKRLKLQKRRLGKAWGRMRNWLREEKTKIGEVMNRHAKLQAVGALSSEVVRQLPDPYREKKERNARETNRHAGER